MAATRASSVGIAQFERRVFGLESDDGCAFLRDGDLLLLHGIDQDRARAGVLDPQRHRRVAVSLDSFRDDRLDFLRDQAELRAPIGALHAAGENIAQVEFAGGIICGRFTWHPVRIVD